MPTPESPWKCLQYPPKRTNTSRHAIFFLILTKAKPWLATLGLGDGVSVSTYRSTNVGSFFRFRCLAAPTQTCHSTQPALTSHPTTTRPRRLHNQAQNKNEKNTAICSSIQQKSSTLVTFGRCGQKHVKCACNSSPK